MLEQRSVPEWIGATPDTRPPPRVRMRLFRRAGRRCEACRRGLSAGDKWQADHKVAIVNGGENRERNLRVVCSWCHKPKTAEDVALKSRTRRIEAKHFGQRERVSRPLPGSRESGIRLRMSGAIEAWGRRT